MTNSQRFRRACSLRTPKSPALLDLPSWNSYGPLGGREALCSPAEDGGPRTEEPLGPKQGLQGQGRWARRAVSLRTRKASRRKSEGKEEPDVPGATRGEAVAHVVHSSGDDGQLLLGEEGDGAGSRLRKCKKQVHRALRRGWETFVTNVYSLTLSPQPPRASQRAGTR